jgi:hypothetical protein
VYYLVLPSQIQILQNPAKPGQGTSREIKEKGLDSLVRSELFQWVAVTPRAKISFSAPFRAVGFRGPRRASVGEQAKVPRLLIFAKEKSTQLSDERRSKWSKH